MKTFAQLNKYIGKADARLISARDGLRAVRNPNGSVAVKIGDNSIVKFGTEKDITLNTHGQLTPKLLKILNTYSPFKVELVYGQWFIHTKDGYLTRLVNAAERMPGWRYADGFTVGSNGEVEDRYKARLDVWDVLREQETIQNYSSRFVNAMARPISPIVTLDLCRCPYCCIMVNKKITLGEIDPSHLRAHINYGEFHLPLICRAVEKASPRHHDKAVVALNKFMKKLSAVKFASTEKRLLSGILRNYLLLELKHPISTNGI